MAFVRIVVRDQPRRRDGGDQNEDGRRATRESVRLAETVSSWHVSPSWTIEEGARMAAVRAHHIFRWCARTLRPADALRPTWWGSLARSGWHGENARRSWEAGAEERFCFTSPKVFWRPLRAAGWSEEVRAKPRRQRR